MPNYSNGKIYTIRFHNSNEIYIGSTTQSLAVRFGGHKRGGSNKCSLYKLINSKYNGDWSVCYYELYENYSCNNKEELCKKEGELIRLFKNDENYECINRNIAGRTKEEYQKIYVENNLEREKIRCQIKNKRFKENNPDYRKKDYEKRKEVLKEKVICNCGSCVSKNYLTDHKKSKKHQVYLASLPTVITNCDECDT